jgi:menaquinol-cytochrome c reductase iron-sulfur subunit
MNKTNISDRRGFLKLAALTGAAAIVTGIPLSKFIIAPSLSKADGKWIDLGEIGSLETGKVKMVAYEFMVKDGWLVLPQKGFVWVKSDADAKLTVFSSICTHLACNVIWREESRIFECPCHSGRFNMEGKPIAGPPSRPLTVLEHKIEEGKVKVLLTV